MKNSIKTVIIVIALLLSSICNAQMVKTVDDIDIIDSNKTYFVGKTVKNLLNEIEPAITMVKLIPGIPGFRTSSLTLYFIPFTEYKKYEKEHHRQPPYLRVKVDKNDFEYNWNGLEWTKSMAEKFSNYIVEDVRAYKGVN